jgi:hypothetical protein
LRRRPEFIERQLKPVNRHALLPLALVLALTGSCASQQTLRPFTTDGCSEFPDGTARHRTLWQQCCIAHDRRYWAGGTYDERAAADRELERCVAAVGEPEVAALMLAGVRVGGSPYWPTRFRWGYGWPWPRGYRALSDTEREQAQRGFEEYERRRETK